MTERLAELHLSGWDMSRYRRVWQRRLNSVVQVHPDLVDGRRAGVVVVGAEEALRRRR
jgi:hypothetical protein